MSQLIYHRMPIINVIRELTTVSVPPKRITSALLSMNGNDSKFYLSFEPQAPATNNNDHVGKVAINLIRVSGQTNEDIFATYCVWVESSATNRTIVINGNDVFTVLNARRGGPVLKITDILNPEFLKNNVFYICCAIVPSSARPVRPVDITQRAMEALRTAHSRDSVDVYKFNVGNSSFPISKALICAQSEYFNSTFKYTDFVSNEFIVTGVHAEVMGALSAYLYTGDVNKEHEKYASELYRLADRFQIKGLTNLCGHLLESAMDESNIVSMIELAWSTTPNQRLKDVISYLMLLPNSSVSMERTFSSPNWGKLTLENPSVAAEAIHELVSH